MKRKFVQRAFREDRSKNRAGSPYGAGTSQKQSEVKLKAPGGYEAQYKGGKKDFFSIGVISLSLFGVGYLVKRGVDFLYEKSLKKDNTSQEVRKEKEKIQEKKDLDNLQTDNKIKMMKAASETRIQEHEALLKQRKEYDVNARKERCVSESQPSLRLWIENFHSRYIMPDYSAIPVLKEVLDGCPADYRDPVMFHLLSAFGGICFSRVRATYLDTKEHSPSLLTIIEGKSGSGKSTFNNIYKRLFERIIDSDRKKLELNPQEQIIQTAGINVSFSKFMDILAFNKGVHMYIMETEIIVVKKAFSKTGGLDFSYLRKAFDNEEVYQNNKRGNFAKGSYPVFLNCTFTGTPQAVDSLIGKDEVEGGTARRFCFSAIPELEADSPTLKLPEGAKLEAIRNKIDAWRQTYSFYHDSTAGDTPCNKHLINLDYVNKVLEEWCKQQYKLSQQDRVVERADMRNGIACVAFHCAIVLHMLAGNPDSCQRKVRKTISELSVYIANYCMERYITKFAKIDVVSQITDNAVGNVADETSSSAPCERKLTKEEIEHWYPLRRTFDENGKEIGYGTIAKQLGVSKDELRNAFTSYKRQNGLR